MIKLISINILLSIFINFFLLSNLVYSADWLKLGDQPDSPKFGKTNYYVDYYLNNQVLPALESIFEVFGIDVNEILEGGKQEKLF